MLRTGWPARSRWRALARLLPWPALVVASVVATAVAAAAAAETVAQPASRKPVAENSAAESPAAEKPAAGKPNEWKLSVAVGPAFALGRAGERWAKLVTERSGGTLTVVARPGATLAQRDATREFSALRDGAADLAVGSSLYWSVQVAALGAVGLPWLAADARPLEALTVGTMKERFRLALEQAGVAPLAIVPLGHRALATTLREVRTPDDAAGLRVRIATTPYLSDFCTALAMLPDATPFAAAQAALRAGTLDAQEGTPAAFDAARLDAVGVRHMLLWDAIAEVAIFAVNAKAWNGLTEAQRTLVSDAAQEAARELPAAARAENEAAIASLRKRGVTVTRLTATGRAAFAAAARGAYDRWASAAGEDLVRAAEAAVAAAAR
jgi:TRAP-type C4-dicarboxylate transport system substrate-binding protein